MTSFQGSVPATLPSSFRALASSVYRSSSCHVTQRALEPQVGLVPSEAVLVSLVPVPCVHGRSSWLAGPGSWHYHGSSSTYLWPGKCEHLI